MSIATIEELTAELVGLVQTAPSIGVKGYSVFNTDELTQISKSIGFPLAGVSYEGAFKKENSAQATNKAYKSSSIVTLRFVVVIGIEYKYASEVDRKPTATNLLDEVRQIVLGYQGVNSRPWRFTGELPLESEVECAILYGQMWETDIPVTGKSPT